MHVFSNQFPFAESGAQFNRVGIQDKSILTLREDMCAPLEKDKAKQAVRIIDSDDLATRCPCSSCAVRLYTQAIDRGLNQASRFRQCFQLDNNSAGVKAAGVGSAGEDDPP